MSKIDFSEKTIISNPLEFEKIKIKFKKSGIGKVHVIADFDNTLIKAFVNGKKQPSLIALLRDGNHLTPDYAKKAHALYDKFAPLEGDPKLTIEEKKEAMQEWWVTHFELLIESGLNIHDIERVIESDQASLREGSDEFFNLLEKAGVPLIIISASGLGVDAISYFLKRVGQLRKNIHIISNRYSWDKNGYATDVEKPIIHSMNKDETVLKEFDFYDKIKDRKNVILLGDNPGDTQMVTGFDYDNLLKIGFLNDIKEDKLIKYKEIYDIVIPGDGTMEFINKYLRDISD